MLTKLKHSKQSIHRNTTTTTNMKIISLAITLASFLYTSAVSVRGSGERALTNNNYDYKYIEVYDQDSNGYKCWEAVNGQGNGNYYGIQAKNCNHNNQKQDWYYTKYGELKNRHYGDDYCVHYDIYNNDYYYQDYLVLEKCNKGGSNQAWNYIHKHWVSHYNGYCIDLDRNGGDYFEAKQCENNNKDQEHEVEDYWFYAW